MSDGPNNNGSHKIVLLEHLPSLAYRNSSEFRAIVAEYLRSPAGFHLVIVLSESGSGGGRSSSDLSRIFPPDFVAEHRFTNVSFNAASNTNLVKALERIAREESRSGVRSFTVPDKTSLTSLAESSSGDIRAAINALQFACLKGTRRLK